MSFSIKLKAHLKSTVNVQEKRQELVQMVQDHALEHDDFDYAAVLLNGLWSVKAYGAAKVIRDYLTAHGPYLITFTKGEAIPFKASCKKAKDGSRAPFIDFVLPYNEWEKEAVEASLTADKIIATIRGALTKAEKLDDPLEVVKFSDFLSGELARAIPANRAAA